MLTDLVLRLRALFDRRWMEHEIEEELLFHFGRQVEAYRSAGLDHVDAVRRARLAFGGLHQVKEEYPRQAGRAMHRRGPT